MRDRVLRGGGRQGWPAGWCGYLRWSRVLRIAVDGEARCSVGGIPVSCQSCPMRMLQCMSRHPQRGLHRTVCTRWLVEVAGVAQSRLRCCLWVGSLLPVQSMGSLWESVLPSGDLRRRHVLDLLLHCRQKRLSRILRRLIRRNALVLTIKRMAVHLTVSL